MSMTETQQHNVPPLRFPEFSGEWLEKQLEDVSSIRTGPFGSSLHEKDYVDEGTPIITVEHLGELGITTQNMPLVSDADKQRLKSYHLCTGDIVFSRVGSVDRNSIVTEEESGWLFSGRLLRIRVSKSQVFPKFLSFSFQQDHTKHRIRSAAVGQTMPSLNTAILKRFSNYYPTLPEQQKISSFLSSVDRKIGQTAKKKALLEQYKLGCMQKLFSKELRFKDAQGNDFPDWEEKRLGEVYEFKSTNSLSRDKLNYEGGEVRNIHYGDIHTKFKPAFDLLLEQVPFVNSSVDLSHISEDKYCQHGDLVIADASEDYDDIGKTIELANLYDEKVLAGLHTLLARLTSKNIHIGFGAFVMACAFVRKQIKIIAQGTKVLGISAGRMANIKLPMPTPEEQQKIADFLTSIDQKIALIATELDHAKTFKKGLLQQMFI